MDSSLSQSDLNTKQQGELIGHFELSDTTTPTEHNKKTYDKQREECHSGIVGVPLTSVKVNGDLHGDEAAKTLHTTNGTIEPNDITPTAVINMRESRFVGKRSSSINVDTDTQYDETYARPHSKVARTISNDKTSTKSFGEVESTFDVDIPIISKVDSIFHSNEAPNDESWCNCGKQSIQGLLSCSQFENICLKTNQYDFPV